MFLSSYDIYNVVKETRHDHARPNLQRLATVVAALSEWSDDNSDGWAYWPKPSRASKRACEHLYREYVGRFDRRTDDDISRAELTASLRPIKAFLTRQGIDYTTVGGLS